MRIKYILPLCLFLLLTACGGRDDTSVGQTVYIPEEVAYTTGLKSVSEACVVDGTCWAKRTEAVFCSRAFLWRAARR